MSESTDARSADITLYTYFRSSAAFRVRIALNLKGLDPQQRFIRLLKHDQSDEEYCKLNPQGVVPTLIHNGHAIGQSLAIIEYLDEVFPNPPLLPTDPVARARARQIAYAIACEIHPLGNLRVREYLTGVMGRTEDEISAWMRHWIAMGLAAVEEMVGNDQFCVGATPTLADICLVPQVFNARRVGLDLSPFPKLVRLEKTAYEFAPFSDARPQNQPDAE